MNHKTLNEQLSEELLKAALIEDLMIYLKQFPTENELNDYHNFSKEFEKETKRTLKKSFYRKLLFKSTYIAKKASAVCLICFGTIFSILFTVKGSRDMIMKSMRKTIDFYLNVEYEKDGNGRKGYRQLQPTFIPNGFVLYSHEEGKYPTSTYINNYHEKLIIITAPVTKEGLISINIKDYKIYQTNVGIYKGQLFITKDKKRDIYVYWDDGVTSYFISFSKHDKEELLRIARSFQ